MISKRQPEGSCIQPHTCMMYGDNPEHIQDNLIHTYMRYGVLELAEGSLLLGVVIYVIYIGVVIYEGTDKQNKITRRIQSWSKNCRDMSCDRKAQVRMQGKVYKTVVRPQCCLALKHQL